MDKEEKEQLFNVLMGLAHEIDQLQDIPLGVVKTQVAMNAKFLLDLKVDFDIKVSPEKPCEWCMLERKEFVENLLAKNTGDVTTVVTPPSNH